MLEFVYITTKDQMALLEGLASQIWGEHYSSIISPEQISYMIEKFQSADALKKDIKDEGYNYYFLVTNGEIAGYIGFCFKKDYVFLSKLYIKKEFRNKGFGRKALKFIKKQARDAHISNIRLTVNKFNTSSIEAYKKWGFEKIDDVVTDIGAGYVMDDYIMQKSFHLHTVNIRWIIFIVTAMGGFLSMLDSSSINVALFAISKDFAAQITDVQWIVVGYILVLSTFLTLFGKLNDVVNRKVLYSTGYIIFGLGSLMNAFAPNFPCLLITRLFQATGASILMSNSYAIISCVFKGKNRAVALGYLGAFIALAGMTGPAFGGFLMNSFGWRAIFIPNVLIALMGAYLAYKFIPTVSRKKKFIFDYPGMLLLLISTSSLLFLIAEGHNWGWLSKKIIALFVCFIVFGVLFYFREKKVKFPIIDFKLFKSRHFSLGNFALMFSYFALFSNVILFPFYTQEVLGTTPLVTGLLILPFSLCFIFTALLGSTFSNKIGSKNLTVVGAFLIVSGLLMFVTTGLSHEYWRIILANMLAGAGNGFYQPSANTAIMNAAPKGSMGISSGILALFRNLGMLLGIMISISVFDSIKIGELAKGIAYSRAFLTAYHGALLLGAFFAIICFILSYKAYKQPHKVK